MAESGRVVLTFPLEEKWILDFIEELVETKKQVGFSKTSRSFEIRRMLRNYLTNTSRGKEVDIVLLREKGMICDDASD
jgi:hypothetical protein